MTTKDLQSLIDAARDVDMTKLDQEAQRRSFVYGNTHLDNDRITHEIVERAAESLTQRTRS